MVSMLLLVLLLQVHWVHRPSTRSLRGHANEVEKGGWETAVCVSVSMSTCTAAITTIACVKRETNKRHAVNFSVYKWPYAIQLTVMCRGVSQELSSESRTDKLWNVNHKTSQTMMFYQRRRKNVMFFVNILLKLSHHLQT